MSAAILELIMNIVNVLTVILLAHMIDKMTNIPRESYMEPISNK